MPETLSQTRRDDLSSTDGAVSGGSALYVALEGERPLSGGMRLPLGEIDELRIGRGATRAFRLEGPIGYLEIPDPRMSSKHARLFREKDAPTESATEEDGWLLEDTGSTNGTFVSGKRTSQASLEERTVVTLGATCLLFEPSESLPAGSKPGVVDVTQLKSRPRGTATLVPMLDGAMPRLVRIAMSKLSVLLLGESGVGKEVLARSVHALSGRSGPFVAINCGALAPTLVESQLFGHVKGAFSGAARDEPGLIRSASGGTLFLDEIGELPAAAQATLLRVLQEKEVLPVGATRPVPVDLRVVAATLKPIDESETFRADLYARISAFVHRMPPLRERIGDLGLLVADLLPRLSPERAPNIRFAPDLATALAAYHYPRNVRELEHVLSVALVTSTDDLLRLDSVGGVLKASAKSSHSHSPSASSSSSSSPSPSPPPTAAASERSLKGPRESGATPKAAAARALSDEDQKLKEELTEALQRTRGNVSEIARTMGRTRMQIHRWMKRFGLDPDGFRGPSG